MPSTCSGPCTAGYYCPANSTSPVANICPPGTYSEAGWGACTNCSAGLYGNTSGLPTSTCSGPCDAGRFGAVSGLTVFSCSGPCSAGYYCPPATTSATAHICPAGTYSYEGWSQCTNCSAGLYGATAGMPNASCSGPCVAGYYGETSGLVPSTCSGPCTAGYYCIEGSTNSTAGVCGPGRYSVAGSDHCSACPAGQYGLSFALPTMVCSGSCTAGRYCPPGSAETVRQRYTYNLGIGQLEACAADCCATALTCDVGSVVVPNFS